MLMHTLRGSPLWDPRCKQLPCLDSQPVFASPHFRETLKQRLVSTRCEQLLLGQTVGHASLLGAFERSHRFWPPRISFVVVFFVFFNQLTHAFFGNNNNNNKKLLS